MRIKKMRGLKLPSGKEICLFILILFMVDSAFHISRRLLGGSNFGRIALLGVMLLFVFVDLFDKKRITLSRIDCAMVFLVALLIIGYLKSELFGGDMPYARTYIINGFIYLLFLPIMYYCLDSIDKFELLIKSVTVIGLITSLLAIILTASYIALPSLYYSLSNILYSMQMVLINAQLGGILRVALSGMVFQVLGIFGGIYFYIKGNIRILWIGITFINFLGVLLTYSRGLIAGIIFALLFWMLMASYYGGAYRRRAKAFKVISAIGAIVILMYMVNGEHGDIFGYIILRFLGISNDGTSTSDIFRQNMTQMINNKILEAPIFGTGLGSHINLRDGAIEMTYQDIVIRIGVIGLFVFVYPYFNMLFRLRRRSKNSVIRDFAFCALTAVMFAAYTNPYLITSLGIFTYCLCIRVFSFEPSVERKL